MSNGRHHRCTYHAHHTGSMPLYITWTSGCCPPRSQPAEDGIAGPRTGRVQDAMARHGRPGQHHHHAPSRPRARPNSRFCYYADLTAGRSSGAVEERGRSSACSNSLRNTAPFCAPSRALHAPFCTPSRAPQAAFPAVQARTGGMHASLPSQPRHSTAPPIIPGTQNSASIVYRGAEPTAADVFTSPASEERRGAAAGAGWARPRNGHASTRAPGQSPHCRQTRSCSRQGPWWP